MLINEQVFHRYGRYGLPPGIQGEINDDQCHHHPHGAAVCYVLGSFLRVLDRIYDFVKDGEIRPLKGEAIHFPTFISDVSQHQHIQDVVQDDQEEPCYDEYFHTLVVWT